MIVFDGYINGKAEKHFWKKSQKITRRTMCAASLVVAVPMIVLAIFTEYWILLTLSISLVFVMFFFTYIPVGKKHRENFTPKKIYTDEEYIVCVGKKYEEHHLINDAARVIDYGDFYDIEFPFGQISDKFICQKDLLVEGTLEEFESLFKGKIERRT